jgi:hypothetical protein
MHFGFDSPGNNFAPTVRNAPEPHRSTHISLIRSVWKKVSAPNVNLTGKTALNK